MDLSRIKNFIKHNGDKFVLVENGEPELVVISFQEYEKLANGSNVSLPNFNTARTADYHSERDFTDIGQAGFHETEFESPAGFESTGNLPIRLEDIRLEDLPI